jgi:hypothetical protein
MPTHLFESAEMLLLPLIIDHFSIQKYAPVHVWPYVIKPMFLSQFYMFRQRTPFLYHLS